MNLMLCVCGFVVMVWAAFVLKSSNNAGEPPPMTRPISFAFQPDRGHDGRRPPVTLGRVISPERQDMRPMISIPTRVTASRNRPHRIEVARRRLASSSSIARGSKVQLSDLSPNGREISRPSRSLSAMRCIISNDDRPYVEHIEGYAFEYFLPRFRSRNFAADKSRVLDGSRRIAE
jgi:hypothetical protein